MLCRHFSHRHGPLVPLQEHVDIVLLTALPLQASGLVYALCCEILCPTKALLGFSRHSGKGGRFRIKWFLNLLKLQFLAIGISLGGLDCSHCLWMCVEVQGGDTHQVPPVSVLSVSFGISHNYRNQEPYLLNMKLFLDIPVED